MTGAGPSGASRARGGGARATLAVLVAVAAVAGCRRTPQKTSVLEALVREVVLPVDLALVPASEALASDADRLAAAPSPVALQAARASWRRAALAWRRAFAFREGPVVETNALNRASFWPPHAARVQALLHDPGPADADAIEALGSDGKGLFVVEAMLFAGGDHPTPESVTADWSGPGGGPRALWTRVLAHDVARYARAVSGRATTGGDAFARAYAAAGQISVNRLVNQMVENVEGVSTNRLGLVLGLADSRLLRAREVEGWPSGTSHELAAVLVTATRQLYVGGGGGGLGALVGAASPAQDARVRAAFEAAVADVGALGAPLERVVSQRRPALEKAARALKDLELALKVDMANALGVTLTFTAGDGD